MASPRPPRPSRRSLLRTAAWSAPLATLVVAAPVLAASEPPALTFDLAEVTAEGASRTTAAGTVPADASGRRPTALALAYDGGFSGPDTVTPTPDGRFLVEGIVCPDKDATGTLTASAPGWTDGVLTLTATRRGPVTGAVTVARTQYRGTAGASRVDFPEVTGTVSVSAGALPAFVVVSFSDPDPSRVHLARDGGALVPIDPVTGAFAIDGLHNRVLGGQNPFGFLYVGVHEDRGTTFGLTTVELIG